MGNCLQSEPLKHYAFQMSGPSEHVPEKELINDALALCFYGAYL